MGGWGGWGHSAGSPHDSGTRAAASTAALAGTQGRALPADTMPAAAAVLCLQEMKVDAILRSGIRRFTDEVRRHTRHRPACLPAAPACLACLPRRQCLQLTSRLRPHLRLSPASARCQVGRLWTSLADYFIRRGMFESARDVYEEGLTSVVTVRDFSLVYDALTQVCVCGGGVMRGGGAVGL